MDSSEESLDGTEAQRTTDVSCTLICSQGLSQNAQDGTTSLMPELSDLYNLPGESVAMSSEIFCAIRGGNIEFLEKMKSWETPMTCFKTHTGDSILHLAAASGHLKLVNSIVFECPSLLLELNRNDQIPLHVAARAGHSKVVEALVVLVTSFSARLAKEDRKRLNPYVLRDKNEDTPLHLALREQYSISVGTMAYHLEHSRRTLKTAACLVDADKCASFLANKDGVYPLYLAVSACKVSLVRAMLNHHGNNIHGNTSDIASQLEGRKSLVHAALKSKNIDILDVILKKDPSLANKRDEGQTCLSLAASVGFLKGLCMLLDTTSLSIFDCDEDGSFPIHRAVEKGHRKIFMELLERFPDSIEQLNKKGQNIFHIAAKSGRARYFLKDCIKEYGMMYRLMEEQDVDGNTPVHLATINWRPSTLNNLCPITKGVLNIQNADGLTPLDIVENNLNPDYVFRERMTLIVLLFAYKPTAINWLPTSEIKLRSGKVVGGGKYKDLVQVLLVVATLVGTMTFAAGFTIPGGFNSSAPNSGMAILVNDQNLTNFVIFDAMAMYSSIVAIVALIWAQLGDQKVANRALNLALPSLFYALSFMSFAFYWGVNATIKPNDVLRRILLAAFLISFTLSTILLVPYLLPMVPDEKISARYLSYMLTVFNEDEYDFT